MLKGSSHGSRAASAGDGQFLRASRCCRVAGGRDFRGRHFVVLPGAVAVLYVIVVLLSVNFLRWRGVLLAALGCVALAVLGYLLQHGLSYTGDHFVRLLVSLSAIGATAFLALKNRSVTEMAYGQRATTGPDARHDLRARHEQCDHLLESGRRASLWMEQSRGDRQGSHQLMQTIFPAPLDAINAELLRTGRWEGELVHQGRRAAGGGGEPMVSGTGRSRTPRGDPRDK